MKVSLKPDSRRLSRHPQTFGACAILCLAFATFGVSAIAQEDASIIVHFDSPLGPVNTRVFGGNQVAYDPTIFGTGWDDVYSNYGAGLWDPVPVLF